MEHPKLPVPLPIAFQSQRDALRPASDIGRQLPPGPNQTGSRWSAMVRGVEFALENRREPGHWRNHYARLHMVRKGHR